jgi:hypothetical protein
MVEELNLKIYVLFFQYMVNMKITNTIAAGIPETAVICRISL